MFKGIEYNGKHSYKDFGLTISNPDISNPSKVKTLEEVPFSNTPYDFSTIYGEQKYEERQLTYTFNIAYREKAEGFYFYEADVLRWLMSTNEKKVLKDDRISGYYFLAEVVNGPTNEFRFVGGSLTVTFTAYPFMIAELKEGNDIWDDFNFILDYVQDTSFTVNGSKEIVLFNPGAKKVYPKIIAGSPFTVIKGKTTYKIPTGITESEDFSLEVGENRIQIIGNGKISFDFYKELI